MTKFTQKSFTVGGSSKAYSDNYERTFRRERDPEPSECKKGKPYREAEIHDGAELLRVYVAGPTHEKFKEGSQVEVYRCADCGREWEV